MGNGSSDIVHNDRQEIRDRLNAVIEERTTERDRAIAERDQLFQQIDGLIRERNESIRALERNETARGNEQVIRNRIKDALIEEEKLYEKVKELDTLIQYQNDEIEKNKQIINNENKKINKLNTKISDLSNVYQDLVTKVNLEEEYEKNIIPNHVLPSAYFDISGMFNLQKKFINILPNTTGISYIDNISYNLQELQNNYLSSNISVTDILTKQNDMEKILNTESQRLNNKKQSIDSAYEGKMRSIQLNESYRLKQNEYTKIVKVVIIVLVLIIILVYSSKEFTNVSSHVFEVAISIVLACGVILVYTLFSNIRSRNNTNFNEIATNSTISNSDTNDSNENNINNKKYDNFLDDVESGLKNGLNFCVEDICCDKGTVWDKNKKRCVVDNTEKFSNISPIDVSIKPNSSNESQYYSFI